MSRRVYREVFCKNVGKFSVLYTGFALLGERNVPLILILYKRVVMRWTRWEYNALAANNVQCHCQT